MVATDDVDFLATKLRDAHVRFVSSGVIAIPKDKAGFTKALSSAILMGTAYC